MKIAIVAASLLVVVTIAASQAEEGFDGRSKRAPIVALRKTPIWLPIPIAKRLLARTTVKPQQRTMKRSASDALTTMRERTEDQQIKQPAGPWHFMRGFNRLAALRAPPLK